MICILNGHHELWIKKKHVESVEFFLIDEYDITITMKSGVEHELKGNKKYLIHLMKRLGVEIEL